MFRCRTAAWCSMLMGVVAVGTSAEPAGDWIRGIYAGRSPRPVLAAEMEAWQQASTLAESTPAAFVLAGSGWSMQPLYAAGTILVLHKVSYVDLERGQTVVYRNRQQKIVAHLLVARVRDGWRVQGLNNSTQDMEPVSPDNLVGVVIAAFQPVATGKPVQLVTLR